MTKDELKFALIIATVLALIIGFILGKYML